jgi:hypothetical protein
MKLINRQLVYIYHPRASNFNRVDGNQVVFFRREGDSPASQKKGSRFGSPFVL